MFPREEWPEETNKVLGRRYTERPRDGDGSSQRSHSSFELPKVSKLYTRGLADSQKLLFLKCSLLLKRSY